MRCERRKTSPWGEEVRKIAIPWNHVSYLWDGQNKPKNIFPMNYRLADAVIGGTQFSLVMNHRGKKNSTKGSSCHLRAHRVLSPTWIRTVSLRPAVSQCSGSLPLLRTTLCARWDGFECLTLLCVEGHWWYSNCGIPNWKFAKSYDTAH